MSKRRRLLVGAGAGVWGKVRLPRQTAAAVLAIYPWAQEWRLTKRSLEAVMLKPPRARMVRFLRGRKLEAILCEVWIQKWGRKELFEEVESMRSWR
jgi:hypothetical protein